MKYPGGKGKCYQHIINEMPPHDTYIESHLGGGAVMRHKKPALRNIGVDIDSRIRKKWGSNFPSLCKVVEADAANFLSSFTYSDNALVYSDPPYLHEVRSQKKIYKFEYSLLQHEELLNTLKDLNCMVMISGYESELYNDVLASWRTVSFDAKTHTGTRKETLWINFKSPLKLHDASFLGRNFRERQTIKRRKNRIQQKIIDMPQIERNELITWINNTYSTEYL